MCQVACMKTMKREVHEYPNFGKRGQSLHFSKILVCILHSTRRIAFESNNFSRQVGTKKVPVYRASACEHRRRRYAHGERGEGMLHTRFQHLPEATTQVQATAFYLVVGKRGNTAHSVAIRLLVSHHQAALVSSRPCPTQRQSPSARTQRVSTVLCCTVLTVSLLPLTAAIGVHYSYSSVKICKKEHRQDSPVHKRKVTTTKTKKHNPRTAAPYPFTSCL